ncbi:MAG: lytic transglycosylase domain-containing protein [Desulfobacterales bacterium]|nr:lytic transglycosylase domain-containing protein [Desulfobacterales bacterium]
MSLHKLIPSVGLISIVFFTSVGADIYRFRDENGVWHFTNIPSDPRYRLYIKTDGIKGNQYIEKYDAIIHRAAEQFGVEVHLIKAIIKAESSFDPNAISESGAQGLMQLMPTTAEDMRVNNPFDPEENIFGGTRYLSILLRRFEEDKRLAVAAYNIGAEIVAKHKSVPPIPKTRRFVERVMKYYTQFKKEGESRSELRVSPIGISGAVETTER